MNLRGYPVGVARVAAIIVIVVLLLVRVLHIGSFSLNAAELLLLILAVLVLLPWGAP